MSQTVFIHGIHFDIVMLVNSAHNLVIFNEWFIVCVILISPSKIMCHEFMSHESVHVSNRLLEQWKTPDGQEMMS